MSLWAWVNDETQHHKLKEMGASQVLLYMRKMVHAEDNNIVSNVYDEEKEQMNMLYKFGKLYDPEVKNVKFFEPMLKFLLWCGFTNGEIQTAIAYNFDISRLDEALLSQINAHIRDAGIEAVSF
jgi:hypothetical protein